MSYFIDEAFNTSKASNTIISLVHHYLDNFSLGESSLKLHVDNCSGQNKNHYVIEYLAWHVLSGFNEEIELLFMVVGHTKLALDWCFALLKRTLRRTKISCLDNIVKAFERSAKVNHAQLVGSQDGQVIVPTYDWGSFLAPHFIADPFRGIKKMHYLRFTAGGKCYVRGTSDEKERVIKILRNTLWQPSLTALPPEIIPDGLSTERRWCLYKIREFCTPETRDTICPIPEGNCVCPEDDTESQLF